MSFLLSALQTVSVVSIISSSDPLCPSLSLNLSPCESFLFISSPLLSYFSWFFSCFFHLSLFFLVTWRSRSQLLTSPLLTAILLIWPLSARRAHHYVVCHPSLPFSSVRLIFSSLSCTFPLLPSPFLSHRPLILPYIHSVSLISCVKCAKSVYVCARAQTRLT